MKGSLCVKGDYIPKFEGVVLAKYHFPGGRPTSDIPTDKYLHVNECGYTEAFKNDILCQRPSRNDFEIFYFASGTALFHYDQEDHFVSQGQIIIIKPGEPHNFIHFAKQKTKSHWIHFTGTGVAELLKELNLWDQAVYTVGISSETENFFKKIFSEIQLDKPSHDKMCVGLFMQLLTVLSRLSHSHASAQFRNNFEQLDPVIEDMYNNFHSDYENSDYAKMCNLSVSHFIALFKQRTGLPPLVFRQNIRMEKAKSLLTTTDLPIKEIATISGYGDTLYFNRIFRKKNGVPPGEYRKKNRNSADWEVSSDKK